MSAHAAARARRPSIMHTAALVVAVMLPAAAAVAPANAAVAAELSGSWSGGGTVTLANGAREKARCRATYSHAGGKTYAMSATCATASAKVTQTAILSQNTKNRYGGTFYNPEYGVTGRIRILVSGKRQTVHLSGSAGRATFSLSRR